MPYHANNQSSRLTSPVAGVLAFVLMATASLAARGQADFSLPCAEGPLLHYRINPDSATVSVTHPQAEWPYYGAQKPAGPVTIPATVRHRGRTYRVTAIGRNAFYRCDSLTAVSTSVQHIGTQAFNGCTRLRELHLGRGLRTIGEGAFAYCRGLTAISLPATVDSVGLSAFSLCTGLRTVTATPATARTFDPYTFHGCDSVRIEPPAR